MSRLRSVTKLPFAIVAERERVSCCLRSWDQDDKTSVWLPLEVGCRVSRARRQDRETASRKPDAMP